jgi:hypothetical protein
MYLENAPHGRVSLQADVLPLPDHADRRIDDFLMMLAKTAAGMLKHSCGTLCIDRARQSLVLQQTLLASAQVHTLEAALAEFTEALSFWKQLCLAERAGLQGAIA